jgi:hypothetical protein
MQCLLIETEILSLCVCVCVRVRACVRARVSVWTKRCTPLASALDSSSLAPISPIPWMSCFWFSSPWVNILRSDLQDPVTSTCLPPVIPPPSAIQTNRILRRDHPIGQGRSLLNFICHSNAALWCPKAGIGIMCGSNDTHAHTDLYVTVTKPCQFLLLTQWAVNVQRNSPFMLSWNFTLVGQHCAHVAHLCITFSKK